MADAPLLIVSTQTESDGIFVFEIADGDGRLKLVRQTPDIKDAFFVDMHPNGEVLYSIKDPGGKELVAALAFDRKTGSLEPINEQTTQGGYPCYVEVDPSGRAVLAANYNGGSVISFPVNEDGSLGEATSFHQHVGTSVLEDRQQQPHAHCFKISADGRFAFAADLGMDKVMIYALDAAAGGALTAGEQPYARVAPGGGPRHFTISPNNRHAYVINEIGNTVTAFDFDSERGLLLEQDTVPTLPADFDGVSHTADLCLTPDGRYLYGSNRGHNSVAMFTVDSAGALTPNGIQPSGGPVAQNLEMSPQGDLLFVANDASNKISAFRIDSGSGKLSPASETELPKPVCSIVV